MKLTLYILLFVIYLSLAVACASASDRAVVRESSPGNWRGASANSDSQPGTESLSEPESETNSLGTGGMLDVMTNDSLDETSDSAIEEPSAEEHDSEDVPDSAAGSDSPAPEEPEESNSGGESGNTDDADRHPNSQAQDSSGLIPEGWPEYIPLIEGMRIRYAGSDEAGMQLVAIGPLGSEDVENFYRALPDWELEPPRLEPAIAEAPSEDDNVVTTVTFQLSREKEILTVVIVNDEEETILQLMYLSLD